MAVANGLDIANTSFQEYFTITVPASSNGMMIVSLQAPGAELARATTLTVYNSSRMQIASYSGAGQYGTILTLRISAPPGAAVLHQGGRGRYPRLRHRQLCPDLCL